MTPSAPAARRAGAAAALLCAAALAAGCASAGNSAGGQAASTTPAQRASSSPATPATASATPTATPSAAACATTELTGTVVSSQGGAAAGSTYYPLNLTNNSKHPCSLFGYPGVSFVTGPSGSQIGRPATRNPAVPSATVVLPPGQSAHVTLQVVDALNYSKSACQPVKAHWIKVFPPGQFSALYVKFTALTCSAKLPGNLGSPLTVDAVKSGAGQPGGGL
jgi:Protein of unknown function (DUF4232)